MSRTLQQYSVHDLKRVYRLLHANLSEEPELMDSELMGDLQKLLQQKARSEGVDVSLHAQWASWLNNEPSSRGL